jgi:hypothetical protein
LNIRPPFFPASGEIKVKKCLQNCKNNVYLHPLEVMKMTGKTKSADKHAPKFLHVQISPSLAIAWKRFRNARSMKRGPLEEQALKEFMTNHAEVK